MKCQHGMHFTKMYKLQGQAIRLPTNYQRSPNVTGKIFVARGDV